MIYRFSECVVDSDQRRLYFASELVNVEPKVFNVLLCLLKKSGELVTHDEILTECWPGRYISEGSLTRSMSRVRSAIGHSARNKLIETIHTKGYRFVGKVEEYDELPVDDSLNSEADVEKDDFNVSGAINEPGSDATQLLRTDTAEEPKSLQQESETETPSKNISKFAAALSTGAERRQITVLSCQLSEEIGGDELDVEDFYQLKQDFRRFCTECFAPLDGYVAQQLADGVVVYFGYPQAQEDSARRAILAGLQLIERLQQAAAELIVPIQVKIGIHTGQVIIETLADGDVQAPITSGPTQMVSMQLCQRAQPKSVLVSDTTVRLVGDYFRWQPLPEQSLSAYQAIGINTRRAQTQETLPVQTPQGITPFIGREAELALLNDRWDWVLDGMGQIILLSGDAGIGKSRLVEHLKRQVKEESHPWLECRCSPYHQNTAFFPIIDLLRRLLQGQIVTTRSDESEETELARLENLIQHHELLTAEAIPLLAELISLPLPAERYPAQEVNPQQKREQMLHILVMLLLAQASSQPLLLIFEDLHWADPSTLELIELLIEQVPATSIMLLLTCRPDFEIPWDRQSTITSMVLGRFNRRHIEQMLWLMTRGKALPTALTRQISENTDGVPLFIEELTRSLLESDQLKETADRFELNAMQTRMAVPLTLQDSLMARLDRLGEAREIARWGAVIGREFSYTLLAAIVPLDETVLQQGLDQLTASGLIFRRGLTAAASYLFKHALVQEIAYQSLLKRQRQKIHRHIAEAMEKILPETVENEPELLALHYQEAQQLQQAIHYWQIAGERALSRSAMQEALNHFSKALTLLQKSLRKSTPSQAQLRQELELQTVLGSTQVALKGQASAEVETAYRRADELCLQLNETEQRFPILWGLWRLHLNRAEVKTARDIAQQLLKLAQQQDSSLNLVAHLACINTDLTLGEFASARNHIEQGLALYDREQHDELVNTYGGWEPGAYCLSLAAQAQWSLGYPDQAAQSSREAMALIRELAQPYALVSGLNYAIMQHVRIRELTAVQTLAQELIDLSKRHDFAVRLPIGKMYLGWALTLQGDSENGLREMHEGVDEYAASGTLLALPIWHHLLAEAYLSCGCHQEAGRVLAETFVISEQTGERQMLADCYRLKGECLRQQDNPQDAETCFQQALGIAREQQAKSLELRAAMSLARLSQSQGKRDTARQLLTAVYDWFSEGFDTADLRQARDLLDELA